MLTLKDIENLTEFLKIVFVSQESFDRSMEKIEKNFSTLISSVDAIAKDNQINLLGACYMASLQFPLP